MEEIEDEELKKNLPSLSSKDGQLLDLEEEANIKPAVKHRKETKTCDTTVPKKARTAKAVPVSTSNKHSDKTVIEKVETHLGPTIHSSKDIQCDKFGHTNQFGSNEEMCKEVKNQVCQMCIDREAKEACLAGLWESWVEKCKDLTGEIPVKLPKIQKVNHRMTWIDDDIKYNYRYLKCPEALQPEFRQKVNKYMKAGWWEMRPTSQAAPLMCIPKKNGKLCTVIDARQWNNNMVEDVTSFPDQDQIGSDVVKAKYHLKIDMSDTYEQIRVNPDNVWKTVFSTIDGTCVSHIMQQGDCNAPSTFQQLMTWIFREHLECSSGYTLTIFL